MILELLLIIGGVAYILCCHLLVDDSTYTKYYYYFSISELTAATMIFGLTFILFGEWVFYGF
jgi:hypothetical protein